MQVYLDLYAASESDMTFSLVFHIYLTLFFHHLVDIAWKERILSLCVFATPAYES